MKRTAAPPAPGQRGPSPVPKKAPDVSNGSAAAPLTYPGIEPADDVSSNEVAGEEKVTLNVFQESGSCTCVTVDSNIPMLDLLVHVAGRCKVSPAAHELQVREEESGKALEFKPHQTVGSLGVTSLYLLPKNRRPDWSQSAKAAGKAGMAFEITQRFTINLPGGQKAVMRISPQLTLGQVLTKVCQDKRLDTARYTLQHPAHPYTPLPLTHTIADSKLSEINLVHADSRTGSAAAASAAGAVPAQRSAQPAYMAPPAPSAGVPASQDPSSWYMPGAGEGKKKKGFLSFLSKKEKKFKLDSHHAMETSSNCSSHKSSSAPPLSVPRSTTPPPPTSDRFRPTARADVSARRPHTMYVTSSSPSPSPRNSPREEGVQDGSPGAGARRAGQSTGNSSSSSSPKSAVLAPGKERGAEPKALPKGGGGKKRPAPPPPQAKAAAGSAREETVRATSAAPVAAAPTPASRKQHVLPPGQAEVTSTTTAAAAELSMGVSAPTATTSASPSSSSAPAAAGGAEVTAATGSAKAASSLLHSRNSSDSSGYHELTLSGAESPEAPHLHLPTTFKTSIDTTSIDSGENLGNGDSGIQDISSPEELQQQQQQGSGRGDLSKPPGPSVVGAGTGVGVGHGGDVSRTLPSSTKKKKAPPPPKAKPAPVQEETSEVTVDEADLPCADRSGTPVVEAEDEDSTPQLPSVPTDQLKSEVSTSVPSQAKMEDEAQISMKLNLDFLEESDDAETERTDEDVGDSSHRAADSETAGALTATSATDSESKEVFDLDDILNSVVFDEEPLRTFKPRTTDDDQDDVEDTQTTTMMMMETASVVSEDVALEVAVDDVRSRPCEFIAPPPPDEPPPEGYSPRGSGPARSYADKSTVVGEDNVSLAPASLKGSPVSGERSNAAGARTSGDDLPSDATVPSPRDLGHVTELTASLPPLSDTLLKEQTADVRQERSWRDDLQQPTSTGADFTSALSREDSGVAEVLPATTSSTTAFAMSEEISAPLETVPPPLQFQTEEDDKEEEEVVTVTEEYIIPVVPGGGLDFSAAVKVSEEEEKKRNSSDGPRTGTIISRDTTSSSRGLEDATSRADRERQGEPRLGDGRQREIQNTVSLGPQDFVGSVKKREEPAWGLGADEKQQKEVGRRGGTTRVVPQDFVGSAKKRETFPAVSKAEKEEGERQKDLVPKEQKPAAKKEEFVLTLEDLSSVSLVPLRPKKYNPPKATSAPIHIKEKQEEEEEAMMSEASGSPQRKHLHLAYVSDHGHVQPARPTTTSSSSFSFSSSSTHPSAKESSPRASSPAAASSSPPQHSETARTEGSSAVGTEQRYRATASLKMTPETFSLPEHLEEQQGGQQAAGKRTSARDDPSPAAPSPSQGDVSGAADLQQQYSSLQEQFSVWQQQLLQNQSLLAAQRDGGPGGVGGGAVNSEDTLRTLQMQMQMQHQMMEQLQRSMQALTLQQKQQQAAGTALPGARHGASSPSQPPLSGVQVTVTPPTPAPLATPPPFAPVPAPAPGPAPAPALAKSVVRAPVRKTTTQPVSSRFQPQLDPREELMIAIRSFGSISGLKTVPVSDTRWTADKH